MAASTRPAVTIDATETRRALRRLEERVAEAAPATGRDAAQDIATVARTIVPYASGGLLGSIHVEQDGDEWTVLAGGRDVPYAEVIHWGWEDRGIEPQPFLTDAADPAAVLERYERMVDGLVTRYDRETPDR